METVVSVRPAGREPVYDIEVEDNHNFVANGLLVHNCHMLSTAAFNALLKTLEEPPSNVVFVLATTDPQRVLPTIISRCQRFDYRRIPLEPMLAHLRVIASQEDIDINDEALRLVAQISQGGLRDAQSLLDQLSLLEPPIEAEAVWDLVGAVPERDLLALVQGIVSDHSTAVLDQARKLMDRGREPLIVLQNLAGFYRDLLIAKTAGDRQDLVAITPPTWAEMQRLVQGMNLQVLLLGQQHLRSAEVQVKNTTQPRLWLEVTLLGLLPSTLAGQVAPVASSAVVNPSASAAPTAAAPQSPTPQLAARPPAAPPSSLPPSSPAASPTPEGTASPAPEQTASPQPEESGPSPTSADQTTAEPDSAPEPSPTPSDHGAANPAAGESQNLDQLWQQVIAVLKPFGTQALMKQQGSLLSFDGTAARIGISSKPLFKMAQGRVSNVEEAFQQIVQHPVTVSLEVLPDPKPDEPGPIAPGTKVPTVAHTPTGEATAPPASPPTPAAPPPAPAPPPADDAAAPSSANSASPVEGNGEQAAAPTAPPRPEIATDFERAVKNFAQFFNGQVVDMEDDVDALISGGRQPSEAAARQPSHADKDVPF